MVLWDMPEGVRLMGDSRYLPLARVGKFRLKEQKREAEVASGSSELNKGMLSQII